MLLFVLFVLASALATSPPLPPPPPPPPPHDRPLPPGCVFPPTPHIRPKCGPNEYFDECAYECPSENCPTDPEEPCIPESECCRHACRCIEGYSRNRGGHCVPYTECDADIISITKQTSSSSSSSFSSSSSSSSSTSIVKTKGPSRGPKCSKRCRPTCKVPNPKNCNESAGCRYCGKGKVWDEDKRKCVLIRECTYGKGCNNDPNASIRENPPPCPSTCQLPDEMPCEKVGLPVGCVCNPGYILSKRNGKCIVPDTCPGGNPCGVNGTFAYCKIDCPSNFCPVDDSRSTVICDPSYTCPSGCVCKYKYLWKSQEDKTCILAQECPEVPCTRPNEEWDSCPPPCFSDSCDQFNRTIICNTLIEERCYPQCRCLKTHARDYENSKCIPGEECPDRPPQQLSPKN